MVLNLGSKQNIIVADQTPTPTRFLRNCEEVGLFQDLQNVNPFEETFRRAVELVKTGSLPEPDLPEDDTLHTPHVFPHMPEENVHIYTSSTITSNKLTLNNGDLVTITNGEKTPETQSVTLVTTVESPDHIYALGCESVRSKEKKLNTLKHKRHYREPVASAKVHNTPAKLKLKQALDRKKLRLSTEKDTVSQALVVNPTVLSGFTKISAHEKIALVYPPTNGCQNELAPILPKLETFTVPISQSVAFYPLVKGARQVVKSVSERRVVVKEKIDDETTAKRQEMLERNRAAAIRCRERKKQWIGTLEKKLQGVCRENTDLQKEVADLRNEVVHLKTLLLAHKECPVTKAMNMGHNIVIGPPQIVTIPVAPNKNTDHGNKAQFKTKTSVIVLNNSYGEMSQ
ncbi:Activating transcription factor-2 [Carabus blaptoides fortunei]